MAFIDLIIFHRNISNTYEQQLHALGSTTSQVMHEHLTHFICENVSIKRILAARLMGIQVVSPQWIGQCQTEQRRVDESEYGLTSELVELIASIDGNSSEVVPVMSEPAARLANVLRSLDSPFFSCSQSYRSGRESVTETPAEFMEEVEEVESAPALFKPNIPLPTFREYIAPVIEPSELKRRRSERLIDLEESDEDDVLHTSSRLSQTSQITSARKKGRAPLYDSVILPDVSLPVIYSHEPPGDTLRAFRESLVDESASDAERRRIRASKNGHSRNKNSKGDTESTSVVPAVINEPIVRSSRRPNAWNKLSSTVDDSVTSAITSSKGKATTKADLEQITDAETLVPKSKWGGKRVKGQGKKYGMPSSDDVSADVPSVKRLDDAASESVAEAVSLIAEDAEKTASSNHFDPVIKSAAESEVAPSIFSSKRKKAPPPVATSTDESNHITSDAPSKTTSKSKSKAGGKANKVSSTATDTSANINRICSKMVLALTGFDRQQGEYDTIRNTIQSIPTSDEVMVLEDGDDVVADFTHLIVSDNCSK